MLDIWNYIIICFLLKLWKWYTVCVFWVWVCHFHKATKAERSFYEILFTVTLLFGWHALLMMLLQHFLTFKLFYFKFYNSFYVFDFLNPLQKLCWSQWLCDWLVYLLWKLSVWSCLLALAWLVRSSSAQDCAANLGSSFLSQPFSSSFYWSHFSSMVWQPVQQN